ncbi:DUF1212-domain-containing protein [Ascodesmis nigricans]|uniref:DUF1212-domain-containing protein n=1 Tax=Ascodesmis nigricans TaxID=341454 RepID=A0A4S2MY41_9PEZI|nr:DUF1212-domain-containing protein [Ascodesmis nigricans]
MSGPSSIGRKTTPSPDRNPFRSPDGSPRVPQPSLRLPYTRPSASSLAGDGSRPSSRQHHKGHAKVRFGSGEVLDDLGSRTPFQLPDVITSPEITQDTQGQASSTDTTAPSAQQYIVEDLTRPLFQSPVGSPRESEELQRPGNRPDPISVPARSFTGYKAVRIDDLERQAARDSGDPFNDPPSIPGSPEPRIAYGGSFSEPNSARSSPTLRYFGVREGTLPETLELSDLNDGRSADGSTLKRPPSSMMREADFLIRNHTQRHPAGHVRNRDFKSAADYEEYNISSPVLLEHPDEYVPKPKQYRHGVLGSLLALYNDDHHHHRSRTPGVTTPTSSGRTTPKWYSKSVNSSTASLGQLLAASGTALGGAASPAAGVKAPRPRLKHRPLSGTFADKIKNLSKPNIGDEIRISIHIADILARQRYILKLCRALMLYGAPTHRLEEYLRMTARVLEVDAQFLYIPGCMIVSFGDISTHTSEMHIVRTEQGVNLSKLDEVHSLYKEVVHDVKSVVEATSDLDVIMKKKNRFSNYLLIPVYGLASAFVGAFGFQARPIDFPIVFMLGCILGFLQLIVARSSELYANVFEITTVILTSFLARAFGSIRGGNLFCFSALTQASIALILPGYTILCGSLELQSKSIVAGSVRMFYAIVYSLFLSFGITIGSALYGLLDANATSATSCKNPLDWRFNFLFVPPFALCLAVINQVKLRQTPIMLVIALAGYTVNWFSNVRFPMQPQLSSALSAFVTGALGNLYSRWVHGLAFAAMLPSIFVIVPGGLAAQGGLIGGVKNADAMRGKNDTVVDMEGKSDSDNMMQFGYNMINVAIGIACGLFVAALVVYPLGKRRSALFSF